MEALDTLVINWSEQKMTSHPPVVQVEKEYTSGTFLTSEIFLNIFLLYTRVQELVIS